MFLRRMAVSFSHSRRCLSSNSSHDLAKAIAELNKVKRCLVLHSEVDCLLFLAARTHLNTGL